MLNKDVLIEHKILNKVASGGVEINGAVEITADVAEAGLVNGDTVEILDIDFRKFDGTGENGLLSLIETTATSYPKDFIPNAVNTIVFAYGTGANADTLRVINYSGGIWQDITSNYFVNAAQFAGRNITNIAVSPYGNYLALSFTDAPYVVMMAYNGGKFETGLLATIDIQPTSTPNYLEWHSSNNYLFVANSTSPYFSAYKNNSGAFTKLPNLTSIVNNASPASYISVNNLESLIAISTNKSFFVYKIDTLDDSFTELTVNSKQNLTIAANAEFIYGGILVSSTMTSQLPNTPALYFYQQTGLVFDYIVKDFGFMTAGVNSFTLKKISNKYVLLTANNYQRFLVEIEYTGSEYKFNVKNIGLETQDFNSFTSGNHKISGDTKFLITSALLNKDKVKKYVFSLVRMDNYTVKLVKANNLNPVYPARLGYITDAAAKKAKIIFK